MKKIRRQAEAFPNRLPFQQSNALSSLREVKIANGCSRRRFPTNRFSGNIIFPLK